MERIFDDNASCSFLFGEFLGLLLLSARPFIPFSK